MTPRHLLAFGLLSLSGCSDKPSPVDTSAGDTETSEATIDTTAETHTGAVVDTGSVENSETGTAETGDTDTAPTDTAPTGPSSEQVFASLITVTEPIAGDQSCYRPGSACATQRAHESCIADLAISGTVVDAEDGSPVVGASVTVSTEDVWGEDMLSLGETDDAGRFAGDTLQTCTAQYWHLGADRSPDDYVPTEYAHRALVPGEALLEVPMTSVAALSALTAQLGIALGHELGMVRGTLTDCAGAPLAGAQVIVASEGRYLDGQSSHYFADGVPDAGLELIGDDGQWLVANAQQGDAAVELWGRVEGLDELLLMAYTDVVIVPGGVTTVDLRIGYCGGILPDACLSSCE